MKLRQRNWAILLMLLTVFIIMGTTHAQAEGPKKVAILPFKINAAEDLTYLQEGIVDMLGSRLAWKGEVEILEKGLVRKKIAEMGEPKNQDQAVQIGRALKADYVIMGSLTVFGESVSIDARIMDVAKAEELVTAFNESRGMDEVIPTINQFALDINEKIMGRVMQPRTPVAAGENKGYGGLLTGEEALGGESPKYIKRFDIQIKSLDVGDVNGDGREEVVFVDVNTVYVYQWVKQSLTQIAMIKGKWGTNYVYVSLGDTDHNGRDEIYVSNPEGGGMSSFVLEWDGSSFKKIATGEPWFFRVIEIPGQGRRLIGQRRSMGDSYQGSVDFLKRDKDRYISAGELNLSRFANALNFVLLNPDGAGTPLTVLLNKYDYLFVFDQSQKEIWTSNEHYGGSYNFVDTGDLSEPDDTGEGRVYFPAPIYTTDVDDDGKPEVMVGQNLSSTGNIVARFRLYSSGSVLFLTWDGSGLHMKYKSKKLPGALVGYRLTDLDQDGRKELLTASVIAQDLGLVRKPRSQIVIFDLK
jgi:TolB-like protein